MTETCDVAGCPRPTDHFPIAQLVLPMELELAADLLATMSQACKRQGLEAVFVDLPDHGNGRMYARDAP